MSFIYEVFPVVIFFIVFKLHDIYLATWAAMMTTAVQVILYRFYMKKWDRKQVIMLATFILFGGLTIYFHDPIFIKWKPTVIFWSFATLIIISHFFMQKTIAQYVMEKVLLEKGIVERTVWRTVNWYWFLFFLSFGGINLYVAYSYDNNAWVNFKFYGLTSALLLFSLAQAFYLLKHCKEISPK